MQARLQQLNRVLQGISPGPQLLPADVLEVLLEVSCPGGGTAFLGVMDPAAKTCLQMVWTADDLALAAR